MNDHRKTTTKQVEALREHGLRRALANEVHARPYEVLQAPIRASHLAVVTGEGSQDREPVHLLDLCARFGVDGPTAGAVHFGCTLGESGLRLRWERHTEFSTYTFHRSDAFETPFEATALDLLPADWLANLPGEVMVAVHAAIATGTAPPDLHEVFGEHLVIGSRIAGGTGAAWSDFRIHDDGFSRVLFSGGRLTKGQTGRMLQRLLELETYRMMALLAFPVARELGPKLSMLEGRVATIIGAMSDADSDELGDQRALLANLTDVAAETERLMAAHSYRFGATRAYQAIVDRCIRELREERIPGVQTFREFFDRRFAPAMRTSDAMADRADALGRRVARASDLLRTRVDIALEENNRDLLESMNRRAAMQLRLQETVEGLSVVAISYYVWGLTVYLLKGVKAAGAPINTDIAALIAVPAVVGLVWIGVKRLKAAVGGRHEAAAKSPGDG